MINTYFVQGNKDGTLLVAASALPDFGATSCISRRSTTSLTKDLGEVISYVEMSRMLL